MSRLHPRSPSLRRLLVLLAHGWVIAWVLWGSRTGAAVPTLVTDTSAPNPAGSDCSFDAAFSPDGGHVVFISLARNLVTNEVSHSFFNVYVRDLAADETTLVSVKGSGPGPGSGHSTSATCSSNAVCVAFESDADDLVANDTNGRTDVFLREFGQPTQLLSVNASGTASGNGSSFAPLISGDGRWVIFESTASDLVADDTNGVADLFVRDLRTHSTTRISLPASSTGPAAGPAHSPSFAWPAGRVAFVQTPSLPGPGSANLADIYVYDLGTGQMQWASSNLQARLGAPQRCHSPALSADGSRVCFWASNSLTGRATLCDYDLVGQSNSVLRTSVLPSAAPAVSADGRFIAYDDGSDVYWIDRTTNAPQQLVNVDPSGTRRSDAPATRPTVFADGRMVAFFSAASNLHPAASNRLAQVFCRDMALGVTHLVSATPDGGPAPLALEVTRVAASANGRQLAFDSTAGLVEEDQNHVADVFLRDLDGFVTALISRSAAGATARPPVGRSRILSRGVSSNGTVLAFVSHDRPEGGARDLLVRAAWVRDLNTQASQLLAALPYEQDLDAVVSGDGRYVAYYRRGFNFDSIVRFDRTTGQSDTIPVVSGSFFRLSFTPHLDLSPDGQRVVFESPGSADLFLVDWGAGTGSNQLVTMSVDGTASGDGFSFGPSFSPDGRWLAFTSRALNLTGDRKDGLFVRDLRNQVTRWLARGVAVSRYDSFPFREYMSRTCFSADSRFLAFASPNGVIVYDLVEATNWVAAAEGSNPSLSGDGRLVAYENHREGSTHFPNVVLSDRVTGTTRLVSRSRTGSEGNGRSRWPVISADARFVVFVSEASDLVENDTNGVADVFVRDLRLGTTLLVSGVGGRSVGGWSTQPLLAPDGRTVVFHSMASELAEPQFSSGLEAFLLRLGGVDSDGDGLDDEWEMAYFSSLARDGSGDFDGDGLGDGEEYLAGTDPTNLGSVFRVFTVQRVQGGLVVLWSAQPGRTYRVQSKAEANAPWTALPGDVVAASSTGAKEVVGDQGGEGRFFRVLLVP